MRWMSETIRCITSLVGPYQESINIFLHEVVIVFRYTAVQHGCCHGHKLL